MGIVSTAVGKFRTTLLIMVFLVIMGSLGRAAMPIASNPNITFPWVFVSVFLEGASLRKICLDWLPNQWKIDF